MYEEKVDLHLINEVKRGNKQAFSALVLKYQYKISKVVSRYVNDPSEVNDITQETFIKAYKAIERFRGDSAFYTWLYRIAINTAKNYLIYQGRRLPDIDLDDLSEVENYISKNSPKDFGTPERLLICDEIEELLYDTIDHLPKDLRQAITLREMEGLSYEEIADVMSCPVGTVRSRIFRAREAIIKRVYPLMQQ